MEQTDGDQSNALNETMLSILVKTVSNDKRVGIGFVNLDRRQFYVCDFIDNDYLSNLEALIIQLNNQEVRHAKFSLFLNPYMDDSVRERLTEITSQMEVDVITGDPKSFHNKDVEQMMEHLLKTTSFQMMKQVNVEIGFAALRAMIEFRGLCEQSANRQQF